MLKHKCLQNTQSKSSTDFQQWFGKCDIQWFGKQDWMRSNCTRNNRIRIWQQHPPVWTNPIFPVCRDQDSPTPANPSLPPEKWAPIKMPYIQTDIHYAQLSIPKCFNNKNGSIFSSLIWHPKNWVPEHITPYCVFPWGLPKQRDCFPVNFSITTEILICSRIQKTNKKWNPFGIMCIISF